MRTQRHRPISRRHTVAGVVAAPFLTRIGAARAETVTKRMGALKLIHSITPWFDECFLPACYKVEVIPFESPTDCKSFDHAREAA